MIYTLTYNQKIEELRRISATFRNLAPYLTEEKWENYSCSTMDKLTEFLSSKPLLDMCCYDVGKAENLQNLLDFRREYEQTLLLLVAGSDVPPTRYLKPGVRADLLLLSPFEDQTVTEVLKEMIETYRSKHLDETKVFRIKDAYGKVSLPYNQIYYFEAKEKKIFARTLNEEYGFYDTIENLEAQLPDNFVRSHRSFIVNISKCSTVHLSKNEIELADGFAVPLSRTYKAEFKKYR